MDGGALLGELNGYNHPRAVFVGVADLELGDVGAWVLGYHVQLNGTRLVRRDRDLEVPSLGAKASYGRLGRWAGASGHDLQVLKELIGNADIVEDNGIIVGVGRFNGDDDRTYERR